MLCCPSPPAATAPGGRGSRCSLEARRPSRRARHWRRGARPKPTVRGCGKLCVRQRDAGLLRQRACRREIARQLTARRRRRRPCSRNGRRGCAASTPYTPAFSLHAHRAALSDRADRTAPRGRRAVLGGAASRPVVMDHASCTKKPAKASGTERWDRRGDEVHDRLFVAVLGHEHREDEQPLEAGQLGADRRVGTPRFPRRSGRVRESRSSRSKLVRREVVRVLDDHPAEEQLRMRLQQVHDQTSAETRGRRDRTRPADSARRSGSTRTRTRSGARRPAVRPTPTKLPRRSAKP